MSIMENSNEERLKMRIAVLEGSVKSCQLECRAGRETVVRLVMELEQERRKSAGSAAALQSLRAELDGLAAGRRSVEVERDTLRESLDCSRGVMEAARLESECLEKQLEELQRKVEAAEEKLQMFLERLGSLLQGQSEGISLPTEENILQDVENLCSKVTEMQARLRGSSEELTQQTQIHQSALQRAELAEQQLHDLEAALRTADTQRDRLRRSTQRHEEFLEELSGTMKVNSVAADLSFDMRLRLISSRAEQLVRHEAAALVESKTLTYRLQRKVKSQKEQLDSAGLHVQVLRRKVSELEEEKKRRGSAPAGDQAHLESRKLQKQLERLQAELRATKASTAQLKVQLKVQLAHASELKVEGRRVWIPSRSRGIYTS